MKVTFVSLFDYDMSPGIRIMSLAKELVKKGLSVDYVNAAWVKGIGSKKKKDHVYCGVNVKYIKAKKSKLSILLSTSQMLKKLNSSDFFHLSKALPIHSIPFYIAKKFKKGKFILDLDDWESVGGGSSFSNTDFSKRIMITFLEEYLSRKAEGVTVASKVLEKRVKDMGVKNVLYIPNGADYELFNPENYDKNKLRKKYGFKKTDFILCYVGTLPKTLSAVDQIIEAVKSLKDVKLLLVGFGEGLNRLKRYCNKNNLRKRVIFTGRVKHDAVPEYIMASDACLLPYSDKYPEVLYNRARNSVKLFEYMSMAKPVIASDLGELSIALRGTKLLFKPDCVEALINTINKVKNSNLKKIGNEMRQRVIKEYNYKIQAERLLKFYKKLL